MRKALAVAGSVSLCLAGCASAPPFDLPTKATKHGPEPTISNIVAKVECEIWKAASDKDVNSPEVTDHLSKIHVEPFKEWPVAVTLTLTVDDYGGLLPTAGAGFLLQKAVTGGTFGIGGTVQAYQERQRTIVDMYALAHVKNATQASCDKPKSGVNLAGDLGIRQQVNMGLHQFDLDPEHANIFSLTGTAKSNISASLEFDVYLGVTGVGPTWALQTFKMSGGELGYTRNDDNKVSITFQPVATVTKKTITSVSIVKPTKSGKYHGQVLGTNPQGNKIVRRTRTVVSGGTPDALSSAVSANQQVNLLQAIQSLQGISH